MVVLADGVGHAGDPPPGGLIERFFQTALMRGHAVAIVFDRRPDGGWNIFVAEDGDNDGVLQADIDSILAG